MATTVISRLGTMANECGITRTFEYFLNERQADPQSYLERCKVIIAFIGEIYAVQDQYITLSKTTFHIKPVPGDKPLWTCCKQYLAQESNRQCWTPQEVANLDSTEEPRHGIRDNGDGTYICPVGHLHMYMHADHIDELAERAASCD